MMKNKMMNLLMVTMLSGSLMVGCQSTREEVMYQDDKITITVDEMIVEENGDIETKVTIENRSDETVYIGNIDNNGATTNAIINGDELIGCSFVFCIEPYQMKQEEIYFSEVEKEDLVGEEINVLIYDYVGEVNDTTPNEVEFYVYE